GLAADLLVGAVFASERPVLFVVLEVTSGLERVDRVLRQVAEPDRLDLDFERALAPEDALDAAPACATEETREAKVEAPQGVLGQRCLCARQVFACDRDLRLQ